MYLTMGLIVTMTVSLCRGTVVENYEKNISCNDIKTIAGFQFPHNGSEKSEIIVTSNKTVIAHALLGKQSFEYFNDVMSIDNHSVITRDCRDLEIKCIVPDGTFVKEICIHYRITEKVKNPDPTDSPTPWHLIIGVTCGVACGVALIIGLSWYFCKKPVPLCDEPVKDQAEMQTTTLSEIPSTAGPLGSGENDTEQDNTLESVHVDSIDPKADGKTPQFLSLDHNFNNEGIQPSENAHDNNRSSTPRAMHRNLRDDPGGINDKGAAIQAFDMKGEAADLVNKHDFDQHQVSGWPTAPETDVESTLTMKNHTHI